MKKFLALTLALLMLLGVLVACDSGAETPEGSEAQSSNDTEGSSDVESKSEETTKEIVTDKYGQEVLGDLVPYAELDYNGKEFYIISRPEDRYKREFGVTTRQDTVDEKVYMRNEKVNLDLGVKITVVDEMKMWGAGSSSNDANALPNYVLAMHQAGAPGVDVIASFAAYSTAASLRECYVNLNSDKMTYLHTDKAYWNQSYIEAASLYDQLYYIIGDINLGVYDKTIVTFVNNKLLDETEYTLDELQELVLDMGWTQEVFLKMIRDFGHRDDNESGLQDRGDTFALVAVKLSEQYDGFAAAFDQILTYKNAQGKFAYNIEGNQNLQDALDALRDIWSQPGAYAPSGVGPSFDIFNDSGALFFTEILYRNASQYSKMANNPNFTYSILPLPMLDEDQDQYQTTPQDAYTIMSVMNCVTDERLEMISAVLDLMASRSYADVRPYYIEQIVKARYIDGAASVEIMNMILNGVVFDSGIIYGAQLSSPCYAVWRNIASGTSSVSQKWETSGTACKTKLEDLNGWFLDKSLG